MIKNYDPYPELRLLKDPERIYQAAKAIREAVPTNLPTSVKVRLGWDDRCLAFEIAYAM
ncbi:tRNA-dihydrouridine synthase [Candidatus Arsenophonus triatominarum]|uniref:tRNA-dihydrouridine synthase n=1 Tax=Candidatus Arsenophonus triatominarum TaxID=57911 RepID=UPI001396891B